MSIGGLSEARLGRMHDVMAGHVEHGEGPGIVTLVSRRGEVHVDAIGPQESGRPSARALTPRAAEPRRRSGLGASEGGARAAREHRTGPQVSWKRGGRARERSSWPKGSGASEARRARSARALDGPPGTPSLPLARRVAAELTCVQIELFLGAGW